MSPVLSPLSRVRFAHLAPALRATTATPTQVGDAVSLSPQALELLRGEPILPGAHSSSKKTAVPLTPIPKPDPSLPDPWHHPPATRMDGKCGLTGVSNMLRFYGLEKDPKDIDRSRYRSWGPGLRSGKFAADLTELSGKTFRACNIDRGDPLKVLRGHLDKGKPVALQYMTGPSNAHWVVLTGIQDKPDGPHLTVQSWGSYHQTPWKEIQEPWRRGYGGPYPHVVGDEASPLLQTRGR